MAKIIRSNELLSEQIKYINDFRATIELTSAYSNDIMGFKDVDSVHLACSTFYAKIVGLSAAQDVYGCTEIY